MLKEIDPVSFLHSMTSVYTPPSIAEVDLFLSKLKLAIELKRVSLEIEQVFENEGFPWDRSYNIIDAYLTINDDASAFFSAQKDFYSYFGSCTKKNFNSAVCHATSECLERIITKVGGSRLCRPNPFLCYSFLANDSIDLQYDLMLPEMNPNYSRSGEAYHINTREATRAAYCECIEREVISSFYLGENQTVLDISETLTTHVPENKNIITYWEQNDYKVRSIAILNEWNVWVVITFALSSDMKPGRMLFKGSAADFNLKYALTQSLNEMNRYAFFGYQKKCLDEKTAILFLENPKVPYFFKDNISLAIDPGPLLKLVKAAIVPSVSDIYKLNNQINVNESLSSFKRHNQDIWFIILSKDAIDIPGTCIKIASPGFRQKPILSPELRNNA